MGDEVNRDIVQILGPCVLRVGEGEDDFIAGEGQRVIAARGRHGDVEVPRQPQAPIAQRMVPHQFQPAIGDGERRGHKGFGNAVAAIGQPADAGIAGNAFIDKVRLGAGAPRFIDIDAIG